MYMGGALYIVPAVRGGYSAYFPQPTLLHVGPPIRNPGTRPMPLERRLRHSLHTPQHKCRNMFDHDGGSVPVRLLLPRYNRCSCVMPDRLFWHPKMRCRLTAAF